MYAAKTVKGDRELLTSDVGAGAVVIHWIPKRCLNIEVGCIRKGKERWICSTCPEWQNLHERTY